MTDVGAVRLMQGQLDVVERDGVQVQGAAMVGWKKRSFNDFWDQTNLILFRESVSLTVSIFCF